MFLTVRYTVHQKLGSLCADLMWLFTLLSAFAGGVIFVCSETMPYSIIGNFFIGFFVFLVLGIVIYPAMLFSGSGAGFILSIVVVPIFVILFILSIYFNETSDKLTKKEQIFKLKKEMEEMQFESAYPQVMKLKEELTKLNEAYEKYKHDIAHYKNKLQVITPSHAKWQYECGMITECKYKETLRDIEVEQAFVDNDKIVDESFTKIIKKTTDEIACMRNEFRLQKASTTKALRL